MSAVRFGCEVNWLESPTSDDDDGVQSSHTAFSQCVCVCLVW